MVVRVTVAACLLDRDRGKGREEEEDGGTGRER